MFPTRNPNTSIWQTVVDDFKFSKLDLGWAKTVFAYLFRSVAPYRTEPASFMLPAQCSLAIVGDWGTGTAEAVKVVNAISDHKPDVFYHLGDIYYSGTHRECQQRFLDPLRTSMPDVRAYTLMGNHDVYSGGHGYYWLVDQLKQESCHFTLGNGYINIVGLNTGWCDNVTKSATIQLHDSEVVWARDIIAKSTKTILMSHHQPFSGWQDVNKNIVATQLGNLGNVAAWFTGHEHRLAIYEPYQGIRRMRTVGAGAIPEFIAKDYFDNSKVPCQKVTYGDDGIVYKHSFAIMNLDNEKVKVDYYDEDNNLLFSEAF